MAGPEILIRQRFRAVSESRNFAGMIQLHGTLQNEGTELYDTGIVIPIPFASFDEGWSLQ
jgi:hypothetical protein